MPLYAYQVIDRGGDVSGGRLEAENEYAAAERLKRMGLTPLEVTEAKASGIGQLFVLKKKVSLGELGLLSRQLAAMLNSGIPLTRCLFALGEQTVNATLKKVLQEVGASVESGMNFSESLRAHPEVFNEMYCDLVKAAELGGTLESVLMRLSVQLDSEKMLKDNIKSAMFYPSVVLIFATLVLVGMLVFLVPVFMGFYPQGTELPVITRIIVGLSDSMRQFWYLYLVGAAAVIFCVKYYLGSASGRRMWDRIKFRVPIFGNLIQKTVVARFSRTLATLLSGGISVLQALETAGPASGSSLVADAVDQAGLRIQEGQGISEPLKASNLFPPMVTLMVAVGEETGDLPSMLNRVAEFYEQEVATITKGLTSLIEPLMLIFVGIVVAGMVIALYLPIFTVITQVV